MSLLLDLVSELSETLRTCVVIYFEDVANEFPEFLGHVAFERSVQKANHLFLSFLFRILLDVLDVGVFGHGSWFPFCSRKW
jgi:hypothetical protein